MHKVAHHLRRRASLSASRRVKISPSLTGPLTFLIIERLLGSSIKSTRTLKITSFKITSAYGSLVKKWVIHSKFKNNNKKIVKNNENVEKQQLKQKTVEVMGLINVNYITKEKLKISAEKTQFIYLSTLALRPCSSQDFCNLS